MGVHRGTKMSRYTDAVQTHFDSDQPLTSLEEVKATAKKWKANYQSLGLQIWFMTAMSPDGENTPL